LKELSVLKDSRVDKIYQPEKNILIFSFYKSGVGKKLLKIDITGSLSLVEEKTGETLGFGMFLRKHLDNNYLYDISQIEPERILKFSFKSKDSKKNLYMELFGKGNAILCDENDIILNSLEHHEFRDRTIKPKIKYKYPVMEYNMFKLSKKDLTELLKNTKKDSLVITLATGLGLGGIYSEEICSLSDIDKKKNPKSLENKDIETIINIISKIIKKKLEPVTYYQDNKIIDFSPFKLKIYEDNELKPMKTFSETISIFYSQFIEVKETAFDRKTKDLNRIIEEQKATIEDLRKKEQEARKKGELIYNNFQLIEEILIEINKAAKKHSWKEIKAKLKGHKMIKEVNDKDKSVVVEV
jgi:predicted ribosome quality control (RQC) complex YloA/Tae2 family protein